MGINQAAHTDQRVAIFIDTQNLYHSAKSNFRANVNYEELIRVAVNGRKLVRAFAYVIRSEENTEGKFFEALEDIGIETRVKDLQIFHTGAKKADWDVGIAVDMIRLTEKVDTVVLASGDGDFLEVVRYCQSRGVRVEIMAFEKTTNAKILEEVDHFTDLGDQNADYLIGNKRRRSAPTRRVLSPATRGVSGYIPATNHTDVYGSAGATRGMTGEIGGHDDSYGTSTLSQQNRLATNAARPVSPGIYGRKTRRSSNASGGRRVKPVIGLPGGGPVSGIFGSAGSGPVQPTSSPKPRINNAFGNDEPPIRRVF